MQTSLWVISMALRNIYNFSVEQFNFCFNHGMKVSRDHSGTNIKAVSNVPVNCIRTQRYEIEAAG